MARNNRRRPQGRPTICSLCGNPVRDLKTAILERDSGEPAHFDCVTRQLIKSENLEKDERILYLGKGAFGVISGRDTGGSVRSSVTRRIQYEDPELRAKWRAQSPEERENNKNDRSRQPTDMADESAAEPNGSQLV